MKFFFRNGILAALCLLAAASSFGQSISGTREANQTFYRSGDEIDFTITLANSSNEVKPVKVIEAVPEGWTVLSSSNNGTTTTGGVIAYPSNQNFFQQFTTAAHVDGFNNVKEFWSNTPDGGYPYAGKSTVPRGDDTNEADTPEPLGVTDFQLHPPNNAHLTVAAFVIPTDGSYTVSDLAVRRVYSEGATVSYFVFDTSKKQIAALNASNDQFWIPDTQSYSVGSVKAGDRIYFAVGNDGDYGWDASEITFTIKTGSTAWRSYNVITAAGSPQATVMDDNGKVKANLELYESQDDNGVNPNDPEGYAAKGSIITWTIDAAAGKTILTYKAKAPAAPKGVASWFGTCDGYLIQGMNDLPVVNKMGLTIGTRTAAKAYYRPSEELDVSINLSNPGSEVKKVTVVEGVPEGWTVGTVSSGGTVGTGGEIEPANQGLFTQYTAGLHAEGFNNIREFWSNQAGGGYPYAGKSSVVRGKDQNESNTPEPLGVRDLQLHPPNNDHLTIASFVAPLAGTYTISDIAARRAYNQGTTVVFMVFDNTKTQIASITASNDQIWVTDTNPYSIKNVKVGDPILFAVNRDGDYGWDATEVAFTIKTGTVTWHSYDVMTGNGYPQASLVDESGKNNARIDFYESTDDFGVERATSKTTLTGKIITWNINAPPGATALTYKTTPPASAAGNASWIGISDSVSITGVQTLPMLLPAQGIFAGHMDIGSVAADGDATYNTVTKEYDVTGSGADIWNNADAFHFLFKEISGDFTFKATIAVDPLESISEWVKAGLMVRDSLDAGSIFYDAVVRTNLDVNTQWRLATGGACDAVAALLTADLQSGELEISRTGSTLQTYYKNPSTGERVLYDTHTVNLVDPVYAGLAVTSQSDGQLSKGLFTAVVLNTAPKVETWDLY